MQVTNLDVQILNVVYALGIHAKPQTGVGGLRVPARAIFCEMLHYRKTTTYHMRRLRYLESKGWLTRHAIKQGKREYYKFSLTDSAINSLQDSVRRAMQLSDISIKPAF